MRKYVQHLILLVLFIAGIVYGAFNFSTNSPVKRDIKVYITGEVKNPGVYELDEDRRLGELLEMAGGLTDKAKDDINLAQKLLDGEHIVIDEKKESIELEKEDVQPNNISNSKVDVNSIDKDQWLEAPGIGESTANRIIEYLSKNKNSTWQDLLNVDGIGEKKLNKIISYFEQ